MLKLSVTKSIFSFMVAFFLSSCELKQITNDGFIKSSMSICDAVSKKIESGAKNITLEANFFSDRLENSFLKDDACPKILIIPYESQRTIKDDEYREFDRVLSADPLEIKLIRVRVKIYGEITRKNDNRYNFYILRYIKVYVEN